MGELPTFYQFFFPDTSSQRLAFPAACSPILDGAKPGGAYLRNSHGQRWEVGIAKDGDTWFFQDGWKEFVREINAKAGDVFVIKFAGNAVFDFKLFGADGVEKVNEKTGEETKETRI